MDDLRLPTEPATGSSVTAILATKCMANAYDGRFEHEPLTTDLLRFPYTVAHVDYDQCMVVSEAETEAEQHLEQILVDVLFATDRDEYPVAYDTITDLGEAGYKVLKTIIVEIREIGPGDYEAAFKEGNIAICGISSRDAYQALVVTILDTFDVLTAEPRLSPQSAEQIRVLRTYIGKT